MKCPGNLEEAGMLFVAMPLILSITGRSKSFRKGRNTHFFQKENAATHISNSRRDWLALKQILSNLCQMVFMMLLLRMVLPPNIKLFLFLHFCGFYWGDRINVKRLQMTVFQSKCPSSDIFQISPSVLGVIVFLENGSLTDFCTCPWSPFVFQDVFIHEAIHFYTKLNINPSKTQILMNKYVTRSDINILNTRVEISQNVKYLGRTFADDGSLTAEVARRIRAGWAAFNAIRREVLQSPQKIRNRLLTTTVIPAMTYGCETWTSKESDTKRLQRAVSNMFEIAGCDPPDMDKQVLRRKLKWAGHVSRMKYDRWAKIASEWDPRGSARPRGRPPKRWADDITDSIKIFIHNEALRGNLGHGRRRIGILEAKRAWSTVGRDRATWRSLVRSIQDGN
uniref:Reverse transcriptase domain-containing protein n=2 Tax=Caenorhabditis japonica TaxID=281687 RepID=A0A8R1IGU3_CAEJA